MVDKQKTGKKGEDLAVLLLRKEGYKILDRNFHSRFGEIDIVAIDGDTLVFVEVKTRWSKEYGRPEESISPRKIRSITKVGQYYVAIREGLPQSERIDLVAIEIDENGKTIRKELIKNISGW